MSHYVIHGGAAGVERLRVLGRVMAPTTRQLLERAGVAAGMRCLDVGCGGGDSTVELARRAGPHGQVVGIDMDPAAVELARRRAAAEGLAQVEFRHAAAGATDAVAEFDAVYARFVLTHLPDPGGAVAWMAAHLRPGGVLVLEDIDFRGHFCDPPSDAFDRYTQLYAALVERGGADPFIGPRLPSLLTGAGCTDLDMHVVHPAGFDPDVKRMAALTVEGIAARVVAAGLAAPAEVDGLAESLRAFADDPRTVMSLPRVVQAWGRQPPS